MIERATAFEFVRSASNGRTGPLIMMCETEDGGIVELFCKFSAGCDQGAVNLAREAISVCLARDLNLPVPKPYLVSIPRELAATISDKTAAARVLQSIPLAFGSTIQKQFSAWTSGTPISSVLLPDAAATLVFDAIIQNPDRRVGNPNCLVKGNQIRLIDHELAFANRLIIGWRAPWLLGGLRSLETPGNHIFRAPLMGREIDFGPITSSWSALRDKQLQGYIADIPTAWAGAIADVNAAVRLICDARDNFEACIAEIRRILA